MENLIDFLLTAAPDLAPQLEAALQEVMKSINAAEVTLSGAIPALMADKKYNVAAAYLKAVQELSKVADLVQHLTDEVEFPELEQRNKMELADAVPSLEADETDLESEQADDRVTDRKNRGERIDYTRYRVNNQISYPLTMDFRHTSPYAFTMNDEQYEVDSWYRITMRICEILYGKNEILFRSIVQSGEIRGRRKWYLAFRDGESVKTIAAPKMLLDSDIVIEQRLSANQHMDIVQKLLKAYEIPLDSVKIYLESDRRPLHGQKAVGTYLEHDYDYVTDLFGL